jgi:N-acetylglucosamine kinase-like BadF-type ATPase
MAICLGIDGGGSKTCCLIGDETSILGEGTAGGSNIVRVGEAGAREALLAAIGQACGSAGVSPQQVARTCIGVAGAARPQVQEAVRRVLAEIIPGQIEVAGDMVIALEAAFGGEPGVIVIAGTGSIAYGANAEAQTARAGGWGFHISDEGSGHWIGRSAISAALRTYDAGVAPEHSRLLEGILQSWGLRTVDELVLAGNAVPPRDFAGLFPTVVAASDGGDGVAKKVLHQAGSELAELAQIVLARLFSDVTRVPVAMSGGVFANSALVREAFYDTLRRKCPAAEVRQGIVQPVNGALARARNGSKTRACDRP